MKKVEIGTMDSRVTLQYVEDTSENIVDLNTIWAKVEPIRGERLLTYEQLHVGQWFEITFQYLQKVNYIAGDPIKYEGQQLTCHSLTELGEQYYKVIAYVALETTAQVDALRGTKNSATDAGIAGQVAYDDDWAYVCVISGTAGNAKWKKFTLSLT